LGAAALKLTVAIRAFLKRYFKISKTSTVRIIKLRCWTVCYSKYSLGFRDNEGAVISRQVSK